MKDKTGSMSLGEIIEGNCFRIPMYQRAYKWEDKQCEKLIDDLIKTCGSESKKSLGLITLYQNGENLFDVVDGQQRFITLSIIGFLLGKDDLINKIEFERDENLERKKTIQSLNSATATKAFTDGDRIRRNAKVISKRLGNISNKDEFWSNIKDNCLFLCGIVSKNAEDEFMNLNAYKTPFSICDHIRSNLITLNTFYKEDLEKNEYLLASALGKHSYKTAIAKLFDEVIRILYGSKTTSFMGTYKSVYDVVSKNCVDVDKLKENRINIIFSDIINSFLNKKPNEVKANQDGYRCNELNQEFDGWLRELIWIAYTRNLLLQLQNEMQEGNFSSAKLIDDYCNEKKKPTFFSLIAKDARIDEQTSNDLARILDKNSTINNVIFKSFENEENKKPNLFLEALCSAQNNRATQKSYYISKSSDLKLDESVVNDCIQSAGKYIISRFLNEQQKSKDSYFQIAPILDFEDKENPKFKQCAGDIDEWTAEELFKENVYIPVIQRDYCMGSHLQVSSDNNREDFMSFILKSFREKPDDTALASTIIIAIDEKNNRFIFDGQQRTYTIYQLFKYFETDEIKEYKFIGRDEIPPHVKEPETYIEESIKNLQTAIKNRCAGIDKKDFVEFIKKNIKFKVKIVSEATDAEQFFMDINGGVPLENYEIYKSRLIYFLPEDKRKTIIKKIENKWLDFFYQFKKMIYKDVRLLTPGYSEEELMEMRFIEYVCRWVLRKYKPDYALPDSFDVISSKSDLVHLTSYLKDVKFHIVETIMDAITSRDINKIEDLHSCNMVKFCNRNFVINSSKQKTIVGYAYLDKDFNDIISVQDFFITRIIRSCSNIGRTSYFLKGDKEASNYYNSDLIMDAILNNILGGDSRYEFEEYKNTELTNQIHVLAGYNNWSNGKLTEHFKKLPVLELPIYYVDYFFDNDNMNSYCNLYKTYYNSLDGNEKHRDYIKKVISSENNIFLFLVMSPKSSEKLILDTGTTFINKFEKIKEYTNGTELNLYGFNKQKHELFLNRNSAYAIRLNLKEKSIVNKYNY